MLQKDIDLFLRTYRKSPIAVYGTGLNAERILRDVEGYDFEYVVSNDPAWIGNAFQGIRVVALEEAIERAEVLLIAAVPAATRIIYERIKTKVPSRIVIFDMMGNRLNAAKSYRDNAYWDIKKEDLFSAIDSHDVISFDIFDTLLMRRFLFPDTVFKIVSKYVKEQGWEFDFFSLRTGCEKKLYEGGAEPELEDIYSEIERCANIPLWQLENCRERELEIEREGLTPRGDIVEAFHYAVGQGKKVYIVSDMYLSGEYLETLLSGQGIKGYRRLLVSCEEKASKHDGSIYGRLKEIEKTGTILHVGDDPAADVEKAKANGVDAFYVMSARDLFLHSSIAHLMAHVNSAEDEILLGVILAEVFNNAFSLGETRGLITFHTVEGLARVCIAPITMQYLSWITEKLRGKADAIALFVSRDGYCLEKVYRQIREQNPSLNLPPGKYFYTSRRIMNEAVTQDESDIYALCSTIDEYRKIDVVKYMEKLFRVDLSRELEEFCGKRLQEISLDRLMTAVVEHKEKIMAHAADVRKFYKKYIDSSGIMNYRKIYLIDLVSHGTSRYGLSRICGKEVQLLALGTTELPNAFIEKKECADSLYGEMVIGVGSIISTMFSVLELAFASKDGQAVGFGENGEVIFDEETKYSEELLERLQSAVTDFISRYPDSQWFLHPCSPELSEALLGVLHIDVSDITEDVRALFEFSDPLQEKEQQYNVLSLVRGEMT